MKPAVPMPPQPAPTLFDAHAERYDREVEESVGLAGGSVRHFALRKVHLLQRLLARPPRRILDFGCGIGVMARALADGFPEASVLGVDPSVESIRRAKAAGEDSGQRLRFETSGLDGLHLPSGSHDLIVAACVFHHIEPADRDHWFRQLLRVAEPGGLLAVFEHNPFNPLTRRAVAGCEFDVGVQLLPAAETAGRMRAAGFAAVSHSYYLFTPPALYALHGIERLLGWCPLGGQYVVLGCAPGR